MNRIAVYPGSFDPFTNGHLDILERSCRVFNRVIVGVLENSNKKCLFTPDQRVEMIHNVVGVNRHGTANVIEVVKFEGLLVEFCRQVGACAVIRGLRAVSDYEYELQMAHFNKKLAPDIETIFMMTAATNSFLSSSIVKEVARLGGDFSDLVPAAVHAALIRIFPPR